MRIVTLEEAQGRLAELIDSLPPGEEIVVTRNEKKVATITINDGAGLEAVPGRGKGKLIILSDDDEHLNDFAEYLP